MSPTHPRRRPTPPRRRNLICQQAWPRVDHPDILQALVGHASSYAVWDTNRQTRAETGANYIIDATRNLLDRPLATANLMTSE